jgi:DNA-binding transcriptional regulator GbsR (MarR family)
MRRTLMPEDVRAKRVAMVDRLALTLEGSGFPKAMAKVYAALMMAEGEGLSTSELMEEVHTSKASITSAMQFLTNVDLVERYSVRGSREAHYRVLKGRWGPIMERKLGGIASIRQTTEEALQIAGTKAARERLEEMRDVYAFYEREIAGIVKRWNERGKKEER